MENKNLLVVTIVLFVLLVSMYGVRFFVLGTHATESKAKTKEVMSQNIAEKEIDKILEELAASGTTQEVITEDEPEEVVEETEEPVVVYNIPVVEKKASNTSSDKKTKKTTYVEQPKVEQPVVEQTAPVEEPKVTEPVQEQPSKTSEAFTSDRVSGGMLPANRNQNIDVVIEEN